jgi:hypothetical protein
MEHRQRIAVRRDLVEQGGHRQAAVGDLPGRGLAPAVPLAGALHPEGSFGQVKLRVDVIPRTQDPDLDLRGMVSREHPPYGSRPRRSSQLTAVRSRPP